MTQRLQAIAAGAAFAIYAALGAAAFAQPMAGMPPGPPGEATRPGPEDPAEKAGRLRDILQLKPAQEPALQAFVTALETARHGMMGPPPGPMPSTTPERLDMAQQQMARAQASLSQTADATRRFYAQLDPSQKRAFDALPPPMMHGGMGMMGPMAPPRMRQPPPPRAVR